MGHPPDHALWPNFLQMHNFMRFRLHGRETVDGEGGERWEKG
ncbi:MAG: hypothetical protein ACK55Z_22755 [bacterium]